MSQALSTQEQIQMLEALDLEGLRALWEQHFKKAPINRLSRDLLIRALAWQLQADAYGGLNKATARERATQVATLLSTGSVSETRSAAYKAGTKLIREWQGRIHEVIVLDDGYVWSGSRYRSLSEIARCITGTRWSGPRFFGLEKSPSKRLAKASRHG